LLGNWAELVALQRLAGASLLLYTGGMQPADIEELELELLIYELRFSDAGFGLFFERI